MQKKFFVLEEMIEKEKNLIEEMRRAEPNVAGLKAEFDSECDVR